VYSWLFHRLPGPLWCRILLSLVLIAAVVWVLFELAFPVLAPYSPFTTEVTLGSA
jgi:hypothetical protein